MTFQPIAYSFTPLSVDGLPEIRVDALHLVEALNEPYELRLGIRIAADNFDTQALLGRDAVLRVTREPIDGEDPVVRRVVGLIRSVRMGDAVADGVTQTELVVVPAFALLGLNRTSRMFQDKTVPEIISAVLSEALAPYNREQRFAIDELTETYPRREHCLQYQESDLDFINRLCEEEGITYEIDHALSDGALTEELERLVFHDRGQHPTFDESATGFVPFDPDAHDVIDTEPVNELFLRRDQTLTSVHVRGTDWTSLGLTFDATEPDEGDDPDNPLPRTRASYEHGLGRSPTVFDYDLEAMSYLENDARAQAKIRLEAAQLRETLGAGVGRVVGFQPGRRFEVSSHPTPEVAGQYVLTRVIHQSTPSGGGGTEPYHNRFECVPLRDRPVRRLRPLRRTKKPVISGIQTAVVAGHGAPSEDLEGDVNVDAHGRVKVRFSWDLESKSTAFVRCQQTLAGQGYGSFFAPRVGMEVIVQFADGDPDLPVVTGCLYNGRNPPPFLTAVDGEVADGDTVSGFRSQSLPLDPSTSSGPEQPPRGPNELHFDDAGGEEELFVRAARDMTVHTVNDRVEEVGHDAWRRVKNDDLVHVQNRQHTIHGPLPTGEDSPEEIDGDLHKTQILKVFGDVSEKVHPRTDVDDQPGRYTLETADDYLLDSQGSVTTKAAKDFAAEVGGKMDLDVTGPFNLTSTNGPIHITVANRSANVVIDAKQIELKGDVKSEDSKVKRQAFYKKHTRSHITTTTAFIKVDTYATRFRFGGIGFAVGAGDIKALGFDIKAIGFDGRRVGIKTDKCGSCWEDNGAKVENTALHASNRAVSVASGQVSVTSMAARIATLDIDAII